MHTFAGKDFLSLKCVERPELELLFDTARCMEEIIRARSRVELLKDKVLGLMFYQNSTRTRISFESAMARLGGAVVGFTDPKTTRAGEAFYEETLSDTVRMMESYADVLVIRHPEENAPAQAAQITSIPVINAGDGYNEHPTQAILDLYTILREKGRLEDLTVGIVGDMTMRVVHSLTLGLALFQTKTFLVSPMCTRIQEDWREQLTTIGLDYQEVDSIDEVIDKLDVVYVTMSNAPSFHNGQTDKKFERPETPREYRIDRERISKAKHGAIVMAPLPRKDEIPVEFDNHSASRYFIEAYYGVAVRMALLAHILDRVPINSRMPQVKN